jgi:ubiquinone/menaquinone biosynthesis C-methylase UbiE
MTSRDSELWDTEAVSFDHEPDHGLHDPHVHEAWRTLLLSLVPPIPSRIADLGCGTGTLSLLLVQEGHSVDGVDFSPEMVRRAAAKVGSFPATSFVVGDAAEPPLQAATYEVVLCRHVLWALPDPAEALARWVDLLTPTGRLVLIEGSWSTGAGLTAAETLALLEQVGRPGTVTVLSDPAYWGKRIDDERYVIVA